MKTKPKELETSSRNLSLNTIFLITALAAIFISSCRKDDGFTPKSLQSEATSDIVTNGPAIIVHSGTSIQAAVDAAQPGTTILIEPGTYAESVVVNKANIFLLGVPKNGAAIIIQNPGSEEDGISVGDAGDGFSLKNVTVQGFTENGVVLDSVDRFTISHVKVINNGEYGIFPVHSSHGTVDHCTASGHSDTGIYVGQSSDVNMAFNVAYENVNGLEIENSSNVNVTNNQSYNNVAGILADLLPGKDIKTSSNVYIAHNHAYDNNHVNFAEPGSLESFVPSGLGILILGTDQTTVENNTVTGNNFTGIAVFSTLALAAIAGIPPEYFTDIEPNADGTKIQKNLVLHNGAIPPPPPLMFPGVDFLWDGTGTNNCWSKNNFETSYPSPLPACN